MLRYLHKQFGQWWSIVDKVESIPDASDEVAIVKVTFKVRFLVKAMSTLGVYSPLEPLQLTCDVKIRRIRQYSISSKKSTRQFTTTLRTAPSPQSPLCPSHLYTVQSKFTLSPRVLMRINPSSNGVPLSPVMQMQVPYR